MAMASPTAIQSVLSRYLLHLHYLFFWTLWQIGSVRHSLNYLAAKSGPTAVDWLKPRLRQATYAKNGSWDTDPCPPVLKNLEPHPSASSARARHKRGG